MDEMTKRFVTAFNQIEASLKRISKPKSHATFFQLVETASAHNSAVRRFESELREFGNLRNAILHGYHKDKPMATPNSTAVTELEAIRDCVLSPPTLRETCKKNVFTCKSTDRVGAIAKAMIAEDYSQVPVYDGAKFGRVLNTDTITRWFSTRIEENADILEEESVGDALRYAAKEKKHVVLGEKNTVFDALQEFQKGFDSGVGLEAVVMTANGTIAETPTGIITVFDVPILQSLVAVARS